MVPAAPDVALRSGSRRSSRHSRRIGRAIDPRRQHRGATRRRGGEASTDGISLDPGREDLLPFHPRRVLPDAVWNMIEILTVSMRARLAATASALATTTPPPAGDAFQASDSV